MPPVYSSRFYCINSAKVHVRALNTQKQYLYMCTKLAGDVTPAIPIVSYTVAIVH